MLQPDELLGTYRLLSRLGAGGMGEVWKAEDTRLGRVVAIKVLPAAVAGDHEATVRLKREARTAAQLNHPNIATTFAIEELEDRIFIVMEFVDGEPLSRVIRRGAVSEAEVCRIGRAVAEALAEAHDKGIVHRDIKPDNIVVAGQRVKVLDFGIAKQFTPTGTSANDPTAFMTQQGVVIGTVHYMSPEQALGKQLDARSDIFSLGVVLYELAIGKLPFRGETVTETIMKIVRDEPDDAIRPGLSSGLNSIIQRCLEKNRDARFSTAAELAAALDRHLLEAPTAPQTRVDPASAPTLIRHAPTMSSAAPTIIERPQKRSRWPLWAGLAAVALLAVLAVLAMQRASKREPQTLTAAAPPPAPVAPSTATLDVTSVPPTETTITPAPPPPAPVVEAPAPVPTTTATTTITPTAEQSYREGLALMRSRQPREARQKFVAAVERDPDHAGARLRLGLIALFEGRYDEALTHLERARSNASTLDPRERSIADLGWAAANADWNEARRIARELHATNQHDPELQRFLRIFAQQLQMPREDGGRPRPPRRGPPRRGFQ